MQKGLAHIWIIVGIVVLTALGGAYYFGYDHGFEKSTKSSSYPVASQTPQLSTTSAPSPSDETANWKTYQNKSLGFTLKYPSESFTTCSGYVNDTHLLLWPADFDCPTGHDIPYEIGLITYNTSEYTQHKKPATITKEVVAGKEAIRNIYKYSLEDGPLYETKESTEIIIPIDKKIIQLTVLGTNAERKNNFEKILQTIKFN